MPLALRQSRDVTSTRCLVQTGSGTDRPLYRQAFAQTGPYTDSSVQTGLCTDSPVQTGPCTHRPVRTAPHRRRVTPAVRVEDTQNEVDDSHTPVYACASVLAGVTTCHLSVQQKEGVTYRMCARPSTRPLGIPRLRRLNTQLR